MARGGSRGRTKPSLYDLSRQFLRTEDREKYTKELAGESDRAAALVAAADVEAFLIFLLELKFSRLSKSETEDLFFKSNAPLSEFAARINVAYGLKLIDGGERDDLHSIRRIRNVFAHAVSPVTFENDLIADECSRLSYREVYHDLPEMETTYGKPKLRYIVTAMSLKKIFAERLIKTLKDYADSLPDPDRTTYLAGIDAILARDIAS